MVAVYALPGSRHCFGLDVKLRVRGDEPSTLGHTSPEAVAPFTVVGVATVVAAPATVLLVPAATFELLFLLPRAAKNTPMAATATTTTIRPVTVRLRWLRCCTCASCSRRAARPAFWRARLSVPMRGRQ